MASPVKVLILEYGPDFTTKTTLLSLKHAFSFLPPPRVIVSDNATNLNQNIEISKTWASRALDKKYVFNNFRAFLSFSTMWMHMQACICWSKYTLKYFSKLIKASSDLYHSPERDLNLGPSRIAVFEDCKAIALTTQSPQLVLNQSGCPKIHGRPFVPQRLRLGHGCRVVSFVLKCC